MDSAEILFEYLRNVLYRPAAAKLDIDSLDDGHKKLGEGLQYVAQNLNEQREFTTALSKGNLGVEAPPPGNPFAAPLKALHASLKHLTWTSQQVAKGDYNQRVDFMGDFADAFNSMTLQLKTRSRELEEENEKNRQKTVALEQSYSLLEQVTAELQQWIVVIANESGEIRFENRDGESALCVDTATVQVLREQLVALERREGQPSIRKEFEIPMPEGERGYFAASSYEMNWKREPATAYVVSNISEEKHQLQQLENVAYQDTLTGISNRYYGMQMLRDWLDEGRVFSICFVDLDNLKFVNDNFGHSEGDVYIVGAAELLKRTAEGGVVSRVGGDEFMLLVPDVTRPELVETMESLRDEMVQGGIREKRPYMCSLSYGVVEVSEKTQHSSSELLSVADERMYEYKRKHKMGRGQTFGNEEGGE